MPAGTIQAAASGWFPSRRWRPARSRVIWRQPGGLLTVPITAYWQHGVVDDRTFPVRT